MMTIIGAALCIPIIFIMVARLIIGMFDKDDPDQTGWWLAFITICGIIGGIMIFMSQVKI